MAVAVTRVVLVACAAMLAPVEQQQPQGRRGKRRPQRPGGGRTERLERLLVSEDNSELVALDVKYQGIKFYDAEYNECRQIERVEWNNDDGVSRFQAVTSKIYKWNHKSAGERMHRAAVQPYGLSETEQPEIDAMIALYTRACEHQQRKDKGKKRKGAKGTSKKKAKKARRR